MLKESHQFSLAWSELVFVKASSKTGIIFEVFTILHGLNSVNIVHIVLLFSSVTLAVILRKIWAQIFGLINKT